MCHRHENIDMRMYPAGWRTPSFDASDWLPASTKRRPFADGLAAKEALPITLRPIQAASFRMLDESLDGSGNTLYHYLIDYGRNFQGHVNISFASGKPGQQVHVQHVVVWCHSFFSSFFCLPDLSFRCRTLVGAHHPLALPA